jgi:pyrroloquinoline-quinone synthase
MTAAGLISTQPLKSGRTVSMGLGSEAVSSLNSLTAEMNLLSRPFYSDWTSGKLSLQRLQTYVIQYYRHVAAFPRYLSAMHTRSEDLPPRQALLENLIDEERGSENHPELWLRFAEALGLARETVLASAALPATQALVDAFIEVTKDEPLPGALAALYVYQSQTPAVAEAKIDGLKRFYGIMSDYGVRFFNVHREADTRHARTVGHLVERHVATVEESRLALRAGRRSLQAIWSMLDAI